MNRNTDLTNYENTTSTSGGGVSSNLMYLLIGGGIGATLALLFAPKSGTALRQDIGDATRRGYDETLEMAGKLRDQSSQLYGVIRDKADQVYGLAAEKLHLENTGSLSELADKATDTGKQLANGAMEDSGFEGNQTTGGPRSSNVH